jgi:hypothetical protein
MMRACSSTLTGRRWMMAVTRSGQILPTVAAHFLVWFVTASVLAACNLFHSLLQHLVGNATTLQSIRKAACSVLIKLSLVAP